jgi:hypothetical protein
VRICGYFSKPEGFREQISPGNNGLFGNCLRERYCCELVCHNDLKRIGFEDIDWTHVAQVAGRFAHGTDTVGSIECGNEFCS